MGSERLPGKVIKPILGQPMILYILNRLKKSKYIDEIVLATSQEKKEEPLIDVVSENGYKVFRGEEDNVLKRYVDTYKKYGGDIIIRVTGDCPFIDPVIVDNVITYFVANNYNYVRLDVPNSFIRGFDVEIFSKEALLKAFQEVSLLEEEEVNRFREHVTLYMYENKSKFKIGYVKGSDFYNKDYRLCVDTEEDFKLMNYIFDYFKDEYVSAKEVINFLDKNKQVAYINKDIKQKNV